MAFWKRKFESNVARDKLVRRLLRARGWQVLTVWECQVERNLEQVVSRVLSAALQKGMSDSQTRSGGATPASRRGVSELKRDRT